MPSVFPHFQVTRPTIVHKNRRLTPGYGVHTRLSLESRCCWIKLNSLVASVRQKVVVVASQHVLNFHLPSGQFLSTQDGNSIQDARMLHTLGRLFGHGNGGNASCKGEGLKPDSMNRGVRCGRREEVVSSRTVSL